MTDQDHIKALVKRADELGPEHFEAPGFNQPAGSDLSDAIEEFEYVYGDNIDSLYQERVVPWGAVALRAHELAEEG